MDNRNCIAQYPSITERIKYFFHRILRRFKRREKSNLESFAENELRVAGLYDEDSDYGGMLAGAVMELIKVFADQGHSGFSAGRTLQLFGKVADFEPLLPLQGTEDEWGSPFSHDGTRQNKRCSHVFMDKNGDAYDINGKVFKEPSGACYTSKDSRVPVTFPYIPKTEYVDVSASEDED